MILSWGEAKKVSAISGGYKYLNKFFPDDFIKSLTEDNHSYRLLIDEDPRANVWRQEIDDCLELAYRYNLVDADLEGRLKKGDWEMWEAAINELRVAKTFEKAFGSDCLRWHPKGHEKKVGEFELVLGKTDKPIFIEVKTVFPRELGRLEERVMEKLRGFAEQVPIAAFLSVHIASLGKTESFSGKKFKMFLARELSSLNPDDLTHKSIQLPDYKDDNTGLHLKIETLPITPNKEETTSHIGVIGGEARFSGAQEHAKHSLARAYEQLPKRKQPCLVILCPSTAVPIKEHAMLNALLGSLSYRVYQSTGEKAKVPKPEAFRKLDGFYHPQRNRQLSATGLYLAGYKINGIEQELEIYHNPFVLNPLSQSLFKGKGVRQLVKKNDQEMEWIE
ncbi:MAG TPA: hypothetical protein VMW60_00360 [Dehalococcoidales bacterium]|nr:hypothetical protein [Dehalococcoidales bacterium]